MLYQANDFLKNNAKKNQDVADMMKMLLEDYKKILTENDYYGYYFSRADRSKGSMCDCKVYDFKTFKLSYLYNVFGKCTFAEKY